MATCDSRLSPELGPREPTTATNCFCCFMCNKTYTEPKVLSCLHFYCRQCLEERAGATSNTNSTTTVISCPKCSEAHKLSKDDIRKLPTAVLTTTAISGEGRSALLSKSAASSRNSMLNYKVACELCRDPSLSKVEAFCHHCSKYLCAFCEEAHKRMKLYEDHTVTKLENMKEMLLLGGTSELQDDDDEHMMMMSMSMICPDHEEELKGYCFVCDKLICRDCMVTNHKQHKYNFLKRASEIVTEELAKKNNELERDSGLVEKEIAKMKEAAREVEKNGADTEEFVNRSFDYVLHQFEKYRSNLLKSIKNKVSADVRELVGKQRRMEAVQINTLPLISQIQQKLNSQRKEAVVSGHKKMLQLAEKLQKSLMECSTAAKVVIPDESASFEVYKTSCSRIIGAIGDSLKCADPIMCCVEGPGMTRSKVGQKITLTVLANQSNDAPCQAIQNVHVELSSIEACELCDTLTVETLKGSTYEVSYTPKVQGQHILKIRVNERPILGNPFQILVKKPILEMNDPVMILKGVKKLGDIALCRNGTLLATQYEKGAIISVDKKTRQKKTLISGLGGPFGIVADKTGSIYVSLNKKCCLQKYDKKMELVTSVGGKEGSLGNFNRPGRLALNKQDEILVCDVKNSRIQVFDNDLEYIRWYSTSRPTGVAVNREGDIFVIESSKKILNKIFDSSKLGIQTIKENLNDPQGVYVDRDYVYVTEACPAQVTVLDHEGDLVTTLGCGVLKAPGGIVGDEDGYLYVCDEELEAICVF